MKINLAAIVAIHCVIERMVKLQNEAVDLGMENIAKQMSQEIHKEIKKLSKEIDNGTGELSTQEELLCRSNQKIKAIKEYRQRTGQGLKEAKDKIEEWMLKNLGYKHLTFDNQTNQYVPDYKNVY